MFRSTLFFAMALLMPGQTHFATTVDGNLRGAAVRGGVLYAWGDRLLVWRLPNAASHTIASSKNGGFGEVGCVDARGTVYLQDGVDSGPLVAIASNGARTEFDRGVEMHNCIATALLGHRGVLITDHYGQVRFYEGAGVYQELYSFYTPSRQAGLLLADVDGDGRGDIFSGNYWIRSPAGFELPWRLFAINTRHETPDSATMSIVLRGKELLAAQGHMRDGGLYRYTAPADPTQLWREQAIASDLHFPHALASGPDGIVVGENNGPGSRLFLSGDGHNLEQIGATAGVHTVFVLGERALTVGRQSIDWWELQRRK